MDYYAGQYAVAITAFERYMQQESADVAAALYYKGLAQSGFGEYQAAIDTWDEIIQSYPESEFWDEAWEQTAEVLWFHEGNTGMRPCFCSILLIKCPLTRERGSSYM